MTLHDELNDAIVYGEPKLAYSIYWASMNGLSLNENFESLKTTEIDFEAVEKLVEEDPFGIQSIKLYSSKTAAGLFHLVLAKTEADARTEIHKHTDERLNAIHDVSHGMDQVLWDVDKNKSEWIRGTKDTTMQFPRYIGLIESE